MKYKAVPDTPDEATGYEDVQVLRSPMCPGMVLITGRSAK